ncbi:phage terminase large subunit-like protein [Roseicyclus mahoneyensis]|uniref:Phage terminase large subunit-like protein n=2 Tax=Roseicyclus mahoneyensis TaxID=164332 RepID=A0A316H3P9_9RHOB|nr:phage terminase large subunit-like protein [Roseicyclus mahoneyensis]
MTQGARDTGDEGAGCSTSMLPAMRSAAGWLASAPQETVTTFLQELSDEALAALPYLFEVWALPHQLPPAGDWTSWVILGGRGAGKTRAGAEWVRSMVEGPTPEAPGRARRLALVGETYDQALAVMVKGESGLIACSPPDRCPRWIAGERRLEWPNGAEARLYSAHDPEALRGPQFDAAWADELAKWPKGQETWDMLQFGLRLGEHPQQVVTTTPRNVGVLKALLCRDSTVVTQAATEANRAHLAPSFLREVRARYGQTRLGRQELDGELLEDAEDALWTRSWLDGLRVDVAPKGARVIVAVDPPVTGHAGSDACGIVVLAVVEQGPPHDWTAVVLEDASVSGASPKEWAEAAAAAYHRHGAARMVAEVNQGGDLVTLLMRQVDPHVNVRGVRASVGKTARAEPVAALYEQGRVRHLGVLAALEDEMCLMSLRGFAGTGSPDRVDALVWAVTEGLLVPGGRALSPQIRGL